MTVNKHLITKEEVNERIDKLLTTIFTDESRSQIQQWLKDGFIKVNDQVVKQNYRCQEDDMISWPTSLELPWTLEPENIPLSIIYEDEDLLVINKPKGMIVHPANKRQTGTLVHALLHYTENLSQLSGEMRPGIVHRLDKDTSGLLVVAKNNDIHAGLTEQFKQNQIERMYEAIVFGVMDHDQGTIRAPIGRDPHNRTRMAVVNGGKHAITHFKVQQRFEKYTHVRCWLETGRTHQIRVHMHYIGHPLVGDEVYAKDRSHIISGQALFAKRLAFTHPRTKQHLQFEIDQPDYFQEILQHIH